MAKVKSMGLRNYIGKLGGAVYYVNKGQNIGRELAPSVSNPRTDAQQTQRMRWANLVSFYRSNQPWMKSGAFETKKQTWSDYNAFVSANSAISPVYLTKAMAAAGGGVVAPYVVTRGSLPSIETLNADGGGGYFVSSLHVGQDLDITNETTAATLSAALLANNSELRSGDQISYIANLQVWRDGVPYVQTRAYEFIINESDSRTLADLGLSDVFSVQDYDDFAALAAPHGGVPMGGSFILSRTISGAIKVSTQSVVLNAAASENLALFTSESAFRAAADSYGVTDSNFLASGYQGHQGGGDDSQRLLFLTIGETEITNVSTQVADRTNFGPVTPYIIMATFAKPVTNVDSAVMTALNSGDESLMPATIDGNVVTLTATNFNNALGHVTFSTFRIVADGETFTL